MAAIIQSEFQQVGNYKVMQVTSTIDGRTWYEIYSIGKDGGNSAFLEKVNTWEETYQLCMPNGDLDRRIAEETELARLMNETLTLGKRYHLPCPSKYASSEAFKCFYKTLDSSSDYTLIEEEGTDKKGSHYTYYRVFDNKDRKLHNFDKQEDALQYILTGAYKQDIKKLDDAEKQNICENNQKVLDFWEKYSTRELDTNSRYGNTVHIGSLEDYYDDDTGATRKDYYEVEVYCCRDKWDARLYHKQNSSNGYYDMMPKKRETELARLSSLALDQFINKVEACREKCRENKTSA